MATILKDSDYNNIQKALGDIRQAKEVLAKLRRCNQDVQAIEDYFEEKRIEFENWKREFFPEKP